MRIGIIVLVLAACHIFPAAASASTSPSFPPELLGVWDVYPWPCVTDDASDSDMRFTIDRHVRGNYEDHDTLASIEQVATAPMTWRVVATSSLDPEDKEGEARIYVLKDDTLVVTNGERADVYVRCK